MVMTITPFKNFKSLFFSADQSKTGPSSDEEEKQIETVGAVVEKPPVPEPGKMKIDLHCHSEASHDCITPLQLMPARLAERQVSIQAITDHNQIWGAQKLVELIEKQPPGDGSFVTVIIGEEISTTEGELIGLFLRERIDTGLTPEETVERIKDQGGLVLLPHGFDPMKRWRLRPKARERIKEHIDIVETFNARISRPRWNRAAVAWSKQYGLLTSAGSDAHTLKDLGSAWVEVPIRDIQSPQDLLDALQGGTPVGDWTHPVIAYAYKLWYRARQRIG
jgi:predicted metal-dependent phosphoesterase TrpH